MVHPTAGHHHKRVQRANINMHVVPLSRTLAACVHLLGITVGRHCEHKLTQLTAKCVLSLRETI